MVSAAVTKSTKPIRSKSKTAKLGSKTTSAKAAVSHPSWKDMIQECITEHREEARSGVSRSTIKKYITEKYRIEIEGTNASQLNRAIAHGAKVGLFALPKGPSGKVKMAPKNKLSHVNENTQPVVMKKASAPKAAVSAKKSAIKPSTASVKKSKAITKSTKKITSAKAATKRPAVKAAAAKVATTNSRAVIKPRGRPKKVEA
ncbi:uncharacterized protein FIBRA_00963 [Fibroporia radiculosa]|uniref:Histone H1 n=1 Tax=Fibroporia radiculosa TaxID=599839 RepID=J4GJ12_9APHY|nr:uncharacterized protein FIBRA_00963 [Fibroporia radiculosa]CCL98955.1 predicted protein [Fibroporia radiculosa]